MWEIISAVVGALSLAFAVYVYYRQRSAKLAEEAKILLYQERLRSIHFSITSSLHSVDGVVQMAKRDGATVDMLQNVSRVARGQLYTALKQIEQEQGYLKTWKYGQLVESTDNLDVSPPVES